MIPRRFSFSTSAATAALVLAMSVLVVMAEALGPGYDMSWNTIDGGGGTSIGQDGGGINLEFTGTIGQMDPGVMSGGVFEFSGGYWSGTLVQALPCPADIAPSGGDGFVNVNDLLAVINTWGICPASPAPCPADIAPAGGDGVVNVNDLLAVLNAWGPCP
jgi:hypothetical protein